MLVAGDKRKSHSKLTPQVNLLFDLLYDNDVSIDIISDFYRYNY